MNFPLLKQVVSYTRTRAAEQRRKIDFSLTTNATLLTPAIIEFLSENRIGVTVSMDGPERDARQVARLRQRPRQLRHHRAKVRALIENHRTRPITARVTLTSGAMDVRRFSAI